MSYSKDAYALAANFKSLKKIHEKGFDLSRDEIDILIQHVENLYERLECNHLFDSNSNRIERMPGSIPDGIECRDATISNFKRK